MASKGKSYIGIKFPYSLRRTSNLRNAKEDFLLGRREALERICWAIRRVDGAVRERVIGFRV